MEQKYILQNITFKRYLILFMLFSSISYYTFAEFVTSDALNVRSGPSAESNTLGQLHKGDEVTVIETTNSWSKIIYQNGEGWVSKNYLSNEKPVENSPSSSSTNLPTKFPNIKNFSIKSLAQYYYFYLVIVVVVMILMVIKKRSKRLRKSRQNKQRTNKKDNIFGSFQPASEKSSSNFEDIFSQNNNTNSSISKKNITKNESDKKISNFKNFNAEEIQSYDFENDPAYQGEIDLTDFQRRLSNKELKKGDIYKIRANFDRLHGGYVIIFYTKDSGYIEFEIVNRAPKLEKDRLTAFFCGVTESSLFGLFLRAEGTICYKCGAMIDAGVDFCPSCGSKKPSDFCGNCGEVIETGIKICQKCGTPVYKEINFSNLSIQLKNISKGAKLKFQTNVLYHSNKGKFLNFVMSNNLRFTLGLIPLCKIPAIPIGQKLIIYYTCTGSTQNDQYLDDVQIINSTTPPPIPPSEYKEINLFDFTIGFRKGEYSEGSKYWSSVLFSTLLTDQNIGGTFVRFSSGDGITTLNLNLSKRPPELLPNQPVVILYTVTADKTKPELDDVLY